MIDLPVHYYHQTHFPMTLGFRVSQALGQPYICIHSPLPLDAGTIRLFSLEKKKVNPNLSIVRLCVWAHLLNHIWLFVTLWTVAHRAPLSMEVSGKNTGMGCRFLLQRIFPTWRSNPRFLSLPHWQADSLPLCLLGSPVVKSIGSPAGILPAEGGCFDSHRYFA